ncbi:glycoside hydrolase family 43 protein [Bacteroides sp.]|uniref:glycoside hydrolase family 43 protein n=1 Tax=Bacteroides sp. TaxID=29523 RepID=UPI003AB2696A
MQMNNFLLGIVAVFVHLSASSQNFGYDNPVLSGMNPDPSVCRVGDDYYLVTSSFIQYPGLPIYHSKDLIHWEIIGYCCREENGFDVSKGSGLYAPTLRYDEVSKTFYVICTNMRNGGNFITHAQDPRGIWSNLLYLKHPEMHGIDPSLMFDEDGKCYFTATHFNGIIQAEINPQTGENMTEPRIIWGGVGGRYPEGPHLYHIGSWYYLIISEGGTEFGHHVVAARSNNPWGPFEECPYNPILSHVEKIAQSNPIQCTGHSDLIQAHDDSWWMVFLATRPNGQFYHLGRETFLAPVSWSRDNWPIVNGNGTVDLRMEVKTLPQKKVKISTKRYEFDEKSLPLEWNYYRHPVKSNYELTAGQLFLKGGESTFVGIRQSDFEMRAETCIDFVPKNDGSEAGLSVRHGMRQYYNIGVTREGTGRYVVAQFRFSQVNQLYKKKIPNTGKVYLRIEADKQKYTLFYSLDVEKWIEMGSMDTAFLAGGFSGVLIGLYAVQNTSSENRSSFEYFDYIGEKK